MKNKHISLALAEDILNLLEESGASEAEKHVALEVAKAMVPVLPNASCSIELNGLDETST
jgi:hypothetical protein